MGDYFDYIKTFGKNRRHSYDSYISSIDWKDKIIENEDKKSLLRGVERLLEEKYDFKSIENQKAAYLKSLELFEGEKIFEQENIGSETKKEVRKMKPVVANSNERRIIFKKLVKEAEQKGFLEDFRLSEPWHHKPFFDGNFISYPYQHNTAIVYRGTTGRLFKKQEHKKDNSYNVQSILNQGYIDTVTGTGEGYVWTFPFFKPSGAGPMNWTSSDGAVLELQIPTKWIEIGSRYENLSDLQSSFGSPEKFRDWLKDNIGSTKTVAFKIPQRVPIKYITGVHDLEVCEEREFLPLKSKEQRDYIDIINSLEGEKVPENPSLGTGYKNKELYQEASTQAENSEYRIELIKQADSILREYYSRKISNRFFERTTPPAGRSPHGIYPALNRAVIDIKYISEDIIDERRSLNEKSFIGKILHSTNDEEIRKEIECINERIRFCYEYYGGVEEKDLSKISIESDEELLSVLSKYLKIAQKNRGNHDKNLLEMIKEKTRNLQELKSHIAKDEHIEKGLRQELESFKVLKTTNLEETIKSLAILDLKYEL